MQLVSLRLRYYSDKLKLNQIMHWLGAIGIVGTQILLRQTRVDSDFTQIIWVKICWLGPLAVQLRQTFYECLIFYQNMILKKELRKQILHHMRWISDNNSRLFDVFGKNHISNRVVIESHLLFASLHAPLDSGLGRSSSSSSSSWWRFFPWNITIQFFLLLKGF